MTTALRADAARNLELILEAAEAAFAEKGHDACVADIATRAGVGQATIFRRFETKDDLIVAVFERKIEKVREAAQAALRKRSAWDGLMEFMAFVTQLHIQDRGFFDGFKERIADLPQVQDCKFAAMTDVSELLERAKAEGALREDIKVDDIPALCAAAAQAASVAPSGQQRACRRYLQLITDGMRAQ